MDLYSIYMDRNYVLLRPFFVVARITFQLLGSRSFLMGRHGDQIWLLICWPTNPRSLLRSYQTQHLSEAKPCLTLFNNHIHVNLNIGSLSPLIWLSVQRFYFLRNKRQKKRQHSSRPNDEDNNNS